MLQLAGRDIYLIPPSVLVLLQSIVLPYEMIELILMKAVVAFYAGHRVHLFPRADVISMVVVSSVCSEWCATVTGSRRSRLKTSNVLRNLKVILFYGWCNSFTRPLRNILFYHCHRLPYRMINGERSKCRLSAT